METNNMNRLAGNGKLICISSTDFDNKEVKFYIEFSGKYYVATSLNKNAVKKVEKLYDEYFIKKNREIANTILKIIENKKDFSLIDEQPEAYKQHCEYNGVKPIMRADFLKEKFEKDLKKAKEDYSNTSMENDCEALKYFEIDFIRKEIDLLNRKYYNIYPQDALRKVAIPMGEKKKSSTELIPVNIYLVWLKDRVKELTEESKETGNITIGNKKNEKRIFKESFVYLKELGFFNLDSFTKNTPTKQEKFLSKILGCNIDYARDLIKNNIYKYSKDEKNGIKVEMIDKVKNDIIK